MAKNSSMIGVAAILLILAAGGDGKQAGRFTGGLSENADISGRSGLGSILPTMEITGILRDLHKLTSIMNHMDSLGQMALHQPERPKLPPPSEMLSKAIPDLGSIIETVAPFLSSLAGGGESFGKENAFGSSQDHGRLDPF